MNGYHWRLALNSIAIFVGIASAAAIAGHGPEAPGPIGWCFTGAGTATEAVEQGANSSLKYRCDVDEGLDTRCAYNPPTVPFGNRPKCKVNCDDHCLACFPHSAGKWAHWVSGPMCVGNCTVDMSANETCTTCVTGGMICAIGALYNDAECDEPAGQQVWDIYTAGNFPSAG